MRNSELGRVIAGLSLVVLLTVAISVAVVVEANWGGRGLVTIAAACTPTPTPTPTQTPPPCNCVSDDCTTLTVECSPIYLRMQKQATQSDGWKGAIQSLIYVEDFDWMWDMWYWEWWPEMEYTYKWTFSPEVNVTQTGDYNVQVTIDDFPTTFTCAHGNSIQCFDDPSTTVQARVIVYDVSISVDGIETVNGHPVVRATIPVGVDGFIRTYSANVTAGPTSRIASYTWTHSGNVFFVEANPEPSATNVNIIAMEPGPAYVTCSALFYISETNSYFTASSTVNFDVYSASITLNADNGGGGGSVGHAWWSLDLNPGGLSNSDFLNATQITRLGTAGFYPAGLIDEWNPSCPGIIHIPDNTHTPTGSYRWGLSLTELTTCLTLVDSMITSPPQYNLYLNNCTDEAVDMGESVGISTIWGGVLTPSRLSDHLNSLD